MSAEGHNKNLQLLGLYLWEEANNLQLIVCYLGKNTMYTRQDGGVT